MQIENKILEKNIYNVYGTEVSIVDNKMDCPICENKYFGKIKESYDQNLNKFNSTSRNLFKFYFDISGELAKSSYEIMHQCLEMEKNLRIYNPSWYYLLTSYQFQSNKFLGNMMQGCDTLYSNFTDAWKNNFSTMSGNIISTFENMNRFDSICNETMNIKERPSHSEDDRNLIKTIKDVDRTYSIYQKEEKIINTNNPENVTRVLKRNESIPLKKTWRGKIQSNFDLI
jgi:hypothetical protein